MARKSARVYYNDPGMPPLWWNMEVKDAKKSVQLDGSTVAALAGMPGYSVGCFLSKVAEDQKDRFPHAFLMAAFTQAACYIVTEFKKHGKNGKYDGYAVRYRHNMGVYVDLNDEDADKVVFKTWPHLAEKKFSLFPPQKERHVDRSHGNSKGKPKGKDSGARSPKVLHGSLQRAVRAGLVAKPIAEALQKMAVR